jgi:hypothetical protein
MGRADGGVTEEQQARNTAEIRANSEGNLRALGGRHGDGLLRFCRWFENGLILGEWWREGSLRNLLREESRARRRAVTEELASGVAEKINGHAEDQAQG